MKKANNRDYAEAKEASKVKLYKTHRGWMSCLSRFFSLMKFGKKEEISANQIKLEKGFDDDALSGPHDSYAKGLAAFGAVLGTTALLQGNASADTTQVQQTIDTAESQVVGSTSESTSSSASVSTSMSESVSTSIIDQYFNQSGINFYVNQQLNFWFRFSSFKIEFNFCIDIKFSVSSQHV